MSSAKKTAELERADYARILTAGRSKVYILSQGDTYITALGYRFVFYPIPADSEVTWIKENAEEGSEQGVGDLTAGAFVQLLRGGRYTHLLVRNTDAYLEDHFGYMFDDNLALAEEGDSKLYWINDDGNTMSFNLIV